MNSLLKTVWALAVAAKLVVPFAHGQARDERVQMTGTVIGRWKAGGMVLIPGGTVSEFILVRADESTQNIKLGQYIFVRYSYSAKEEVRLPKELYKELSQWQFTLKRIEGSDGPMRDILYSKSARERDGTLTPLIEPVPGAENQYLPLEVVVPLYEAELGSIRKQAN